MKKTKFEQGFSLMEMMVVLLIVSIVAAASAPMITKKMVRSAGGTSPWVWAGTQGGIAFNMSGNDNATMAVGAINDESNRGSRLFIKGNDTHPFVTLRNGSDNLSMSFADKGLALNENGEANENCVAIGYDAEATTAAAAAYNPSTTTGIALLASKAPAAKKKSKFKNYKAWGVDPVVVIDGETEWERDVTREALRRWDDPDNPVVPPAPANQNYQPPTLSGNGGATGIGNTSKAQGQHATAVGYKSQASAQALAIGAGATGTGERSVAVGKQATAAGTGSISVGSDARTTNGSISIGYGSRANNGESVNCIGIGREVSVSGDGAIAIGSVRPGMPGLRLWTGASGKGAVAINGWATAEGALALGGRAEGFHSSSIGGFTSEDAPGSIAIHGSTGAEAAIAIGGANANAAHTIAIGSQDDNDWATYAEGENSIAIGTAATTGDHDAIAIGSGTEAAGNAIAIGNMANSSAAGAGIAIGGRSHAYYTNSVAIGGDAVAGGAFNDQSVHDGSASTKSTTRSRYATAIGVDAQAAAERSTAVGCGAYAEAENSTAIGNNAHATAANQIVLGTADSTVYIPGNLVVERTVRLSNTNGFNTYIRMANHNGHHTVMSSLKYAGNGNWSAGYMMETNATTTPYSCSSDRRLKNVGEAFKGGLEQIKKLEVFHYTFKKDPDKTPRVGIMAQDLQKIFPDAVKKGDDGFLRIRMEDMFYALVNAVKELDSKITALSEQFKTNVDVVAKLKETVDSQSAEIKALKAKNAELEKQTASFEKKTAEIEKRLAKLEKKEK